MNLDETIWIYIVVILKYGNGNVSDILKIWLEVKFNLSLPS